jgi:hypothetical protein
MPHNDQHNHQWRKNRALLAVLVALIILVYAISLMRMGMH